MADIWYDVDAALAEVPVNILPLIDDTDFKSIEGAVAYDAAGMALRWHFVTSAGAYTVTSVTPTTSGNYDWTDQGDSGIYTIEIPASGGASINNDTEGYGWFTGVATGILPWRGPVCGFRASGLNDLLCDSAYSTTRGLAGTALPAAAADAAGGLIISDAGGLDADAQRADVAAILVDTGTTLDGRIPAALMGGRMDANMGAISLDSTAADNCEAYFDGTGYTDVDNLSAIRAGTAQAGAGGTITLDASANANDDFYNYTYVQITGGTGIGQSRFITDYVGATKVATVNRNWVTNPDNTSVFIIWPFDSVPGASAPTASEVADEVETRTIAAVTLVNGLAANVITAAATAADFTTEIQSGLATAAALDTVDNFLDTEIAALITAVDALPTNAELTTALGTADDAVLAQIALVKAKTDSLTFTVANVLDANIQRINDVTITGDGQVGTEFNV